MTAAAAMRRLFFMGEHYGPVRQSAMAFQCRSCAESVKSRAPSGRRGRLDDEDRVSERVLKTAGAGAPRLVDRGPPEGHAVSPRVVIVIGAVHPERGACVPTVAGHRAVNGQLDGAALEADD